MRYTDVPTTGPMMKMKNTTTRPIRPRAIASITPRSLAKTDRCTAGRGQASAIGAADEAVAQPAHGLDEGGAAGIVAELLAQPGDEHVHGAVEGLPVQAARGLQ